MKKLLLIAAIALYSLSQVYATDSLQPRTNPKQKNQFDLQTFNLNHNFKQQKKLMDIINNYEMPSLIEPLILNGLDFYKFMKKYEEIEIYSKGNFEISIDMNYFNPEVKLLLEIKIK
jgi:hypothetical protein